MPSKLRVMLPRVMGYLVSRNWTCSIPSNPQRMKEAWENHEATGGEREGGRESGKMTVSRMFSIKSKCICSAPFYKHRHRGLYTRP